MKLKNIIGQNIKKHRKEQKDLSQAALGIFAFGYTTKETNAAQQKITKLEAGTQDITIEEFFKIAYALGVNPVDLLEGSVYSKRAESLNEITITADGAAPIIEKINYIVRSGSTKTIDTLKAVVDYFIYVINLRKIILGDSNIQYHDSPSDMADILKSWLNSNIDLDQ